MGCSLSCWNCSEKTGWEEGGEGGEREGCPTGLFLADACECGIVGATVVCMMGLGRAVLRERGVCGETTWGDVVRAPVEGEAGEKVRDTVALDDAQDLGEGGGMWERVCVVWGSGVKESDVSIGLLVDTSAVCGLP